VAKYFGDDTAERMGRMTLNPTAHIDPIGTILLPLITLLMPGGFFFGYAKPVPVVASRLRNPAKDMPMVALAGPMSNFIMAFLWSILLFVLGYFVADTESNFFVKVASVGVIFNLILFAFNMLPILPLDGGRVLMGLLPANMARSFSQMEPYGMFIVLGLAFMTGGLLFNYWVYPIVNVAQSIINLILYPLHALFA
jgi:Zn-dependent protease